MRVLFSLFFFQRTSGRPAGSRRARGTWRRRRRCAPDGRGSSRWRWTRPKRPRRRRRSVATPPAGRGSVATGTWHRSRPPRSTDRPTRRPSTDLPKKTPSTINIEMSANHGCENGIGVCWGKKINSRSLNPSFLVVSLATF